MFPVDSSVMIFSLKNCSCNDDSGNRENKMVRLTYIIYIYINDALNTFLLINGRINNRNIFMSPNLVASLTGIDLRLILHQVVSFIIALPILFSCMGI